MKGAPYNIRTITSNSSDSPVREVREITPYA